MGGERRAGGQMDGFGHLDLGKCQPSQNGGVDRARRADQDLSGTQLTNSPVGYLPPHSLTLRALFTLVPSECGPTAQARQRLPTTKLAAAAAAVGGAKQTAKSLSLTRV